MLGNVGHPAVGAVGEQAAESPFVTDRQRDVRLFTRIGTACSDAEWDRYCAEYDQIFTLFPPNGAHAAENTRIRAIKARNPATSILSYASALNIANMPDDRPQLLAHHPDWFLRDEDGEPIYDREFPLSLVTDPGNDGWRDYLATACAAKVEDEGYDGIWLDLVQPVYYPMCNAPAINPRTGWHYTDDEWRDDQGVLAARVKRAIGPEHALLMNGAQAGTRYLQRDYPRLLREADGVCFEGFVHGTGLAIDEFRPADAWHDDLRALIDADARGKLVQCFTKHKPGAGTPDQIERTVLYSFATFLLGKGPNCSYSVYRKTPGVGQVAPNWPIPELWRLPLGAACGPPEARGSLVVRDYARACAAVNPTTQVATLDLGGPWYTPSGETVTSWPMEGNTGAVFLR